MSISLDNRSLPNPAAFPPYPYTDRQAEFMALGDRLAAVAAEQADEHDRNNTFPRNTFEALRASGYHAITVPEEAILVRDDNFSVFVLKYGIAKMRAIKLGIRLPGKVEVREGLKEGEEIIVNGLQKVNEGSPVVPSEFPADQSPVS